MGTLSHVLEAAGLSTIGLSLVRGQTERLHPPRALYCEFPLGRPLGRPGDARFQRRVLEAALTLLERPSGPVLEDFSEVIEDEVDAPLSCTIPPRVEEGLHPAIDEVRALRQAYERQRRASGRTMVGRQINPDQVADAVAGFVRLADGEGLAAAAIPGDAVKVANDIRAYYEEAAMALVDHVPAARSAESWYFRATATGDVMRRAHQALRKASGPAKLVTYLVPRSQQLP